MKGLITASILVFALFTLSAQSPRLLTIEECVYIAIENNLTIKRSKLDLENSKVGLLQSRAAQLPNANLQASYGSNWGRSIDPTTNDFISQQITSSGFGGSSNVTLFNGFQLMNGMKQSKVNVEASEYNLEKATNDISLNVASFYLNVIFNKELVENAQYQLESSQSQLDRTKRLVALGSLPLSSELQLASQVATNEVTLINQQNALDIALLNLKQALLIPSSEEIDIVVPEIELDPVSVLDFTPEELYGIAEQNQPEIKSADLNVESAQLGLRISSGAQYPSLGLGGGFSTNYSDAFDSRPNVDGPVELQPSGAVTSSGEAVLFPQFTEFENFGFSDQYNENLSWRLGIQLNIPLFNGLSTHSNIQRSKIFLQQAEISSVEQRNTLRQQIETAHTNAVAASKAYEASIRQVEALEETFRSVENQYNLGAANFTDYQVASNNLFGARSDLVRAKYDYIFKMEILDFYQGKPISLDQ